MTLSEAIHKLEHCEQYVSSKESDYELKNILTFLLGFQPVHESIKTSQDSSLIARADFLMYRHMELITKHYGMDHTFPSFGEHAHFSLYQSGKLPNPITGNFVTRS